MNSKRIKKISAPGKLIISGEHAVVYGYPALVTAVNRRLTISSHNNKNSIKSNIPIGCGMGSSAAFAVAFSALSLKAKDENLDPKKINEMAYRMEKKRHGNPSGVDNTVSTYGGYLWYRKESEGFRLFSSVKVKKHLPKIYLIDTGRPVESTKEMVDKVGKSSKKDPKNTEIIFKKIEKVTKSFLQYLLGEKTTSFKDLIKENEALLEKLGVVSGSTIKLIRQIERIGGAAKVSGAGGWEDRSGILLVYHNNLEKLHAFAKKRNIELLSVKLGEEGLRIE